MTEAAPPRRARHHVALLLTLWPIPAVAADPALYPAAQCAALWFGWNDFARRSTMLDRTPGDLARAKAFRSAALRLTTQGPHGVDAFIAQQRPLMFAMIDGGILGGTVSADLMERLMTTCDTFGGSQPELRGLN